MSAPGFPQAAAAIAIILSVIVRWIRSGASWQAVEEGRATADVLRELTGLVTLEQLQEAFGPPRLEDGIFPVTQREVLRQRTGAGYLIGDKWLDRGSFLIAIVTLLPIWPVWGTRPWLDVLLAFAGFYQLAGWVAVSRLTVRR